MAAMRLTVGGEVRPLRSRAVDEQRDRALAVEGRDGVPPFAGDAQELAAGHQRPQARSRPNQSSHDPGRRREQLFQVVEDEEHRPIAQVGAQRLACRPVGRFPDVEGDRDGRLQEVRIPERREVDEPDAMREQVASASGDGKGEPGLAAAARPGQGDDPAGEEIFPDAVDLVLPADEGGDLAGQVRRDLGRPERAWIVGRARDHQPVQRDRDPRNP